MPKASISRPTSSFWRIGIAPSEIPPATAFRASNVIPRGIGSQADRHKGYAILALRRARDGGAGKREHQETENAAGPVAPASPLPPSRCSTRHHLGGTARERQRHTLDAMPTPRVPSREQLADVSDDFLRALWDEPVPVRPPSPPCGLLDGESAKCAVVAMRSEGSAQASARRDNRPRRRRRRPRPGTRWSREELSRDADFSARDSAGTAEPALLAWRGGGRRCRPDRPLRWWFESDRCTRCSSDTLVDGAQGDGGPVP